MNLKFTGTAAVTATPTPTPTAAPTAAPTTPTLAQTGGGVPLWPIGLALAALGLAGLAIRRRAA
jgi:MYXO-CTERM domain-containing protein